MSGATKAPAKRRWEQKFRSSGARMVGVRLSPAAASMLEALRRQHDCSDRDVIEGLLFGNVVVSSFQSEVTAVMHEHGFSRAEAQLIVENRWNSP